MQQDSILLKKPQSGIWQPKKGDNFTTSELLEFRKFFEDDLKKAWSDFDSWDKFTKAHPKLKRAKNGLGGGLSEVKRAIYEAEINLKTVTKLIELNK